MEPKQKNKNAFHYLILVFLVIYQCCYKKNSSSGEESCIKGPEDYTDTSMTDESNGIYCPKVTQIANNCGMAGVYQPEESTICTDIC